MRATGGYLWRLFALPNLGRDARERPPDAMSDTTQVDATSTATTDQDSDLDQIQGLGDKGKETIRKEREARRIAEEKATAAASRLAELEKAEAKRTKDEQTAAEAKAIEDKKFEELAEKRGHDLQSVSEERDALKDRTAQYEALITPIVAERLASLKTASADVAKGFPTEAGVLDQLAWLDDPRTKALIATAETKVDNLRKFPGTPRANGDPTHATDADAKRGQSRMYRDF